VEKTVTNYFGSTEESLKTISFFFFFLQNPPKKHDMIFASSSQKQEIFSLYKGFYKTKVCTCPCVCTNGVKVWLVSIFLNWWPYKGSCDKFSQANSDGLKANKHELWF